jgi:hypothetical protein
MQVKQGLVGATVPSSLSTTHKESNALCSGRFFLATNAILFTISSLIVEGIAC